MVDHFIIYTNTKSLYHKSETDKILLVNYTSIKKYYDNKEKNMCSRTGLDTNTFISNQQLAWCTVHNRHLLDFPSCPVDKNSPANLGKQVLSLFQEDSTSKPILTTTTEPSAVNTKAPHLAHAPQQEKPPRTRSNYRLASRIFTTGESPWSNEDPVRPKIKWKTNNYSIIWMNVWENIPNLMRQTLWRQIISFLQSLLVSQSKQRRGLHQKVIFWVKV